ncbi:MAG: glutamate 5-kinase [Actinomycetota bacterium]|nr:glutamate 5-kinase [Actinomycetota bacterium]
MVKIGTASLVGPDGEPEETRVHTFVEGIARLTAGGVEVIVVSSGAIAAGLGPLGLVERPTDIPSLQAAAAVGQGRLLGLYTRAFEARGMVAAQVLLTRYDFMHRHQYLNARNTIDRLLTMGVVPVVNENDTVAVDEISFGDNDRLAALVANLSRARLLVLLTNAGGLHERDPRADPGAPVIDEVQAITPELERAAGGRGSDLSSGGMASKLSAAWVATFSGVGVVVADARTDDALTRIATGDRIGTFFHPRNQRGSARRLWIAFAQPPRGTVSVDDGARSALIGDKRSLLAVGVTGVSGDFAAGDTVDVAGADGVVFARGLIRYAAQDLESVRGRPTAELAGREVIHRDQLVVLRDE